MRALYFTENNWNCPRITHEKRDCRQWFRTYLTYVKDPTWLLNVRDFSLCITRRHVLESNVVYHGSSLTFPLSNGSGISANYFSTVSTSDMKHRESVTRSSKMYGSWPAINRTTGCPPPEQSQSALGRLEVSLCMQRSSEGGAGRTWRHWLGAANGRKLFF